MAVVSSLVHIRSLIIAKTLDVNVKCWPLPGRRQRVLWSLYFFIVAQTVCFDTLYLSAARAMLLYDTFCLKYSCTIRCLQYIDNTILLREHWKLLLCINVAV